jgi:beta-1,4-N-acetylglucosaminyltransferase
MMVQYGSAKLKWAGQNTVSGISIETKPYISNIDQVFASSDLIISHAGSGSILSGLRMGKDMIIVPNTKLMDNHQVELAEVLQREGYLLIATVG